MLVLKNFPCACLSFLSILRLCHAFYYLELLNDFLFLCKIGPENDSEKNDYEYKVDDGPKIVKTAGAIPPTFFVLCRHDPSVSLLVRSQEHQGHRESKCEKWQ